MRAVLFLPHPLRAQGALVLELRVDGQRKAPAGGPCSSRKVGEPCLSVFTLQAPSQGQPSSPGAQTGAQDRNSLPNRRGGAAAPSPGTGGALTPASCLHAAAQAGSTASNAHAPKRGARLSDPQPRQRARDRELGPPVPSTLRLRDRAAGRERHSLGCTDQEEGGRRPGGGCPRVPCGCWEAAVGVTPSCAVSLLDEPLRRVVCCGWRLLKQILKFPEIQRDAEPQAQEGHEALELVVSEVEEQVLQQPVQVLHADDAVPVGVHAEEGGEQVLQQSERPSVVRQSPPCSTARDRPPTQ